MDKIATDLANSIANNTFSNKPYLYSIAFLFLLAMHYYQPNGGGQGLSLAFNNTVWIAISVIIAVGLWRMSQARQIFYTPFDLVGLAAIGVLALPLLWAESPWREATYERYLAIIAFWLIIFTHRQFHLNDKEQQYFWMIISGGVLIQCLIGLVQYAHAGEWMIIPNGRPAGTFQQVNVYASFLATGLAMSIYQLLQYMLARWCVVAHLLIVFLVGVLQWLVFSRTGLLGCILVLVGLGLLYRQQKAVLVKIGLVFTLGVFSAVGLQQLSGNEGRSIESAKAPGYRTTQYSLSWELIKKKPLLGHGLGKFQTVFLEKQAQAYAKGRVTSTHGATASSHPHNEVLFWWVEAGVLPVLVFLLLVGGVIGLVWRYKNHYRIAAIIIGLPIVLHTQTEYPLYHSSVHLCLLALLLTVITNINKSSVPLQFYRLPQFFGGLAVVLALLFMSTNLHAMYVLGRYGKSGQSFYLAKVINPFGMPNHLNRFRSKELISLGSAEALALSEKLLLDEIQLRPSEGAYAFLNDTYRLLGEAALANAVVEKAQKLFPESEYFQKQKGLNVE